LQRSEKEAASFFVPRYTVTVAAITQYLLERFIGGIKEVREHLQCVHCVRPTLTREQIQEVGSHLGALFVHCDADFLAGFAYLYFDDSLIGGFARLGHEGLFFKLFHDAGHGALVQCDLGGEFVHGPWAVHQGLQGVPLLDGDGTARKLLPHKLAEELLQPGKGVV